ncbi:hypothetical protein KP509_03G077000 [Ceratopteris richardii]|uniref:ABC transporter domain-containing protein n=1 Tax=Ceratopteris richardii TaxID=49495 RepID=A0A8T2V8T3_CERRI|nr:hypothetical protein KP509_03G077000 [Ceratopteris richardii]
MQGFQRSETSKSFADGWFSESQSAASCQDSDIDDEVTLSWEALQKLPTYNRMRIGILPSFSSAGEVQQQEVNKCISSNQVDDQQSSWRHVDICHLQGRERSDLINHILRDLPGHDNDALLSKIRRRIDTVGLTLPTVEVRFQNLSVDANCYIGERAVPTLWNACRNSCEGFLGLLGTSILTKKMTVNILKNLNGVISPSRLTLLLGPPGSGKTTMLMALAGQMDSSLKVKGEITYNGYRLDEFVPQKTSSYVSQSDLHLGELTVQETLDFSCRCQGVGSKYDLLKELCRREREAGIYPEPDIDLFLKATSVEGIKKNLQTNYIMKLLGLEECADTIVGDSMIRGVSGGQRKRVTTGEMIVGHTRVLFMDEISSGLDSSTTFQIVKCLSQFAHHLDYTIVISLLQPAPETYELFDDIILLSEGQIVYQGPREYVLEFFKGCGFRCPERKGVADFLQEVTSVKDQQQYWCNSSDTYRYVSPKEFGKRFEQYHVGKGNKIYMSIPFDKSNSHNAALQFSQHSISKIELLRTCFARELLLIKRNSFVFIFRTTQIIIMASIAMTVFLRNHMHRRNEIDGDHYLGALFFALIINMFNGYPEIAFILFRLPVFFKQRALRFYPAWAFTLPTFLTRLPMSVLESGVWVIMTYYTMGFAPQVSRFFKQFLLLFSLHQMSTSLFRLIGGICRSMVVSGTGGSLSLFMIFLLGGYVVPKDRLPTWWSWGYWISPLTYAQNAISVNEMLSPEWNHSIVNGTSLGVKVLRNHDIPVEGYWYWLGTGVLLGMAVLFNILFTIALAYIKAPARSQATITREAHQEILRKQNYRSDESIDGPDGQKENEYHVTPDKTIQLSTTFSSPAKVAADTTIKVQREKGMILPFVPLTISFCDINYSVDMPRESREQGITRPRLQILNGISGAFRPGILTALMGISGAGKTTLMDVLAGRKTGGYVEGSIKISSYPKKQETFARICGYCEQNDIHSPQLTVYESLLFSAWLRLPCDVSTSIKKAFVNEVMELVELDTFRDTIVGIPGFTGLSTEQRKRLTIAVELVANPSIIFMDEPTSGLDARAAAIVMRTVRNTVDTGRTVVCTIHQPGIDIFEAFDELLLLKRGGHVIYAGPLGVQSRNVIEYFEAIPGVPRIKKGQNPATWMLEVTSASMEAQLNIDFALVYQNSDLNRQNRRRVEDLSQPDPNSKDLEFATVYSQSCMGQIKCCLWKQHLTYWRSPDYNCTRFFFSFVCALLFGTVFWNVGQKLTEQGLLNVMGAMYGAVMFVGISNCSTVQPVVAVERTVFYRERAAGMYSAFPYALAHVVIEIPYIFLQTLIYAAIVYFMMNLPWVTTKFFWFFFIMYFTFLYFTYYGMMAVSITPNIEVAAIVASTFYSLFNLFSGFYVPKTMIPGWWIWYYWICPVSWTVYGIISGQYGDVNDRLSMMNGNMTTVQMYVEEHLGYEHDFLSVVAIVLVGFSVFFAFMYALCIKHLNFQQR